jgi:hypothetical protein
VILAEEQTHKSIKQNRELRNRSNKYDQKSAETFQWRKGLIVTNSAGTIGLLSAQKKETQPRIYEELSQQLRTKHLIRLSKNTKRYFTYRWQKKA